MHFGPSERLLSLRWRERIEVRVVPYKIPLTISSPPVGARRKAFEALGLFPNQCT
jgi:hypothetical protein